MIRLLRHEDSMYIEEDGAARFEELGSIFRSRNEVTSHWPIRTWINFLRKGGGPKKRFHFSLNPASPDHFLHIRPIQGDSGSATVDPTLQDNVLLQDDFIEYIYHVGNAHDIHSIIQSGLSPGCTSLRKGRHAVHFTTVNPMSITT